MFSEYSSHFLYNNIIDENPNIPFLEDINEEKENKEDLFTFEKYENDTFPKDNRNNEDNSLLKIKNENLSELIIPNLESNCSLTKALSEKFKKSIINNPEIILRNSSNIKYENDQFLQKKKSKSIEKKRIDNKNENIEQSNKFDNNRNNINIINNNTKFKTKQIKHNKYSKDNIIKGIKCLLLKICLDGFNIELKKSDIDKLKNRELLKLEQLEHINKTSNSDNCKFFEETIGFILSGKVSGKYKEKNDNNLNLIKDLYNINNNGNEYQKKITQNFIDFLGMKLEQFLNYLISYLSSEYDIDKKGKKNLKENENNNANDNVINSIIKDHSTKIIDNYLKKKCHNIENYKKDFMSILINLPNVLKKYKNDNKINLKLFINK